MYSTHKTKIYKFSYNAIILPDSFPLSAAQKIKLTKFTFLQDQEKYLKRHYILNNILAKLLEHYEVCYDPNGRLYLRNYDLNISITHSNDYFIIGISEQHKLGLDIEELAYLPNLSAQAQIFLTKEELHYFSRSKQNILVFYKFWTAKEAILKALGTGFLLEAKNLNICLEHMQANFNDNKDNIAQIFFRFEQFENYLTCIAHI